MKSRRTIPALGAALMAVALAVPGAFAQESLTLRKIKETGLISIGYRDGSMASAMSPSR